MSPKPRPRKTNHPTSIAATLSKSFILLGVFSVVAATCFQIALGWQARRNAIIGQQKSIASDAAQQVSGFIERMFDLLESAAQIGDPLSDNVQERRLLLEKLLGVQGAFYQVAVLDSQGQELSRVSRLTLISPADLGSWADTSLFAQVSQKRRYIGSVYVEEATNEPFVTLAVPLQNVYGDFEGALVADVSLKFMWNLVASVRIGRGGLVYVVDELGNLIAFGDPSLVLRGENLSTLEPVAGFIGGRPEQSYGISMGIGGNLVSWAYIPLGEPNWAVVVETPVAEAYRASFLNVGLSLVAVLGVLVLAIVGSVLVARRLAAPIYKLTETATRIAGGEADLRAPAEGPIEVSSLAEAFNSMTARLRARNVQLQTAAEVSKSVSTLLDTSELLGQTVNLIRERFDFYYVGLFLMDETGEHAVLRAGSGEAGRQMVEAGHKLEVGGDSMIGWCVAHAEPRIALDVGKEAIRFDNPFLPRTRSEMALPLVLHGQVIGALTVQSVEEAAFSEEDVTALQSMAEQLAVAIKNARLFEEANQHVAELEAVRRAGLRLTSSLELQPVLQAILDQAFHLVSADNAHIFLYDGARLAFGAAWWAGSSRQEPFAEPRPDGLTYTVARSGEQVVVPDMKTHPLFQGQPWKGAILGLPLRVGDEVVGVMSVAFDKPHLFGEDELRVLGLLADQAAIAIRNARLYQDTRRQARRLAALIEISRDISATLDLPTVLERIATHASDLLDADESEVYLLQEDGETLRAIVALGAYADEIKAVPLRLGEGVVGHIAQSGEAEIVNHTESDPRSVQIPDTPLESSALMCAPLLFKPQVTGVMSLARLGEHEPFQPDDLDFLVGLARQAAIAIKNAKLYATEQQHAAELARTLERQRELDRLKDEFVQNVSHELRTPLSIARGYAELLAEGDLGELRPEQREPVTVIARRVKMLSKLVNDLTAIMEVGAREMDREPVDFAGMVRDLVDDFRVVAQNQDVSLVTRIAPGVQPMLGDAVHLRRVLDNLLGNALKFTPPGGRIAVRLRQEDENMVLEVQDSGIGIPADKLEHVFDRFYQVDGSMSRRYGGTGLGLALVKEIVTAHGGDVTVESRVGEGSTFTVTLPLYGTQINTD